MVTFGIEPISPETGYGYLELAENDPNGSRISEIVRFIEKPDLKNAERMFVADNFLWNAGIFLFSAKNMIDAFKKYSPETLDLVSKAVKNASPDLGFLRLEAEAWSMLEDISIDYARGKAKNLVAVNYKSKWSDLGGWDAVWLESTRDSSGNAISRSAYSIECSNTLLRSENESQKIVGLGLESIMAIAMPDAVLVAHKSRAQDVKKAVDLLRLNGVAQAEVFPKDHRPWGWFESLVLGPRFQVKYRRPGCSIKSTEPHTSIRASIVAEGTQCNRGWGRVSHRRSVCVYSFGCCA